MLGTNPQTLTARVGSILLFALAIVLTHTAQAQTLSVLHAFTNGADGAEPWAGVTVDAGGNLYGTATSGGYTGGNCETYHGCGTVFRLKSGSFGWTLSPLYTFNDNDGASPFAGVIFGPDGTLYGTTYEGGAYMAGTVYNLRPPATACKSVLCPWTENVLWSFQTETEDGAVPGFGNLTFDTVGHIYGTTIYGGGLADGGTVFELAKQPSGSWSENINYSFGYIDNGNGGSEPYAGVIFDANANLYTTTNYDGAYQCGTVAQLENSPSGWTENVLYTFTCRSDGGEPFGGLIFDQAGNLYGTTSGFQGSGTVFELSPSNGGWTFDVIYTFTSGGSWAGVTMDAAGNLYGTGGVGAYGHGAVFKLTRSGSSWTYSSLHDFTGGSDGGGPVGGVAFDAHGNLYGTTANGGNLSDCDGSGCGVVWEITP